MRILGIDFGQVRIGISISDPFGWTAQILKTIQYKDDVPYGEIIDIIKEHKVSEVVVGYPKNMNGSIGEKAIATDVFIENLEEQLGVLIKNSQKDIKILKWDERLTTVSAYKLMTETGTKTKNKKKKVDMIASQYILQNYLDFRKK